MPTLLTLCIGHVRLCVCGLYVGGLQATAELLTLCDSEVSASDSAFIATLRRYACMTLTNLTYADTVNKTTLCQMSAVLKTLVALLRSPDEDLRQVCTVPRCVCMLLSVCLSVCHMFVSLCVRVPNTPGSPGNLFCSVL